MDVKNLEILKIGAAELGITLNADQIDKFVAYYERVVESNRKFNLTAIVDERDFVCKHFLDSLTAFKYIGSDDCVCDVGTGAGFPAVPLAIVGAKSVFALDSTEKKTRFVQQTCLDLGITNVGVVTGRAEEQRKYFGTFDIVTARAVASLAILLELAAPLLKLSGKLIAYKTDPDDLLEAGSAAEKLNMTLLEAKSFTLPNGDPRMLFIYQKTGETPSGYPRSWNAMKRG